MFSSYIPAAGAALRKKNADAANAGSMTTLVERNNETSLSSGIYYSPAGEFLNKREFTGLEVKMGETAVEVARVGESGIAWDYHETERLAGLPVAAESTTRERVTVSNVQHITRLSLGRFDWCAWFVIDAWLIRDWLLIDSWLTLTRVFTLHLSFWLLCLQPHKLPAPVKSVIGVPAALDEDAASIATNESDMDIDEDWPF